jgi:hypothetical protein
VTIHAASESSRIDGYIDAPVSNTTVSGRFTVAEWAADQTAWTGSGIGTVHVWAHRRDALAFPTLRQAQGRPDQVEGRSSSARRR